MIFYALTDIERMYGQRKLIAQRVPVVTSKATGTADDNGDDNKIGVEDFHVPDMTDDETATDTELETETEAEPVDCQERVRSKHQRNPSSSSSSGTSLPSLNRYQKKAVSQHDLFNKYFRRDTVILKNIDLLRSAHFVTISFVLITIGTQG